MVQFWELGGLTAEDRGRLISRAETDIQGLLPDAEDVIKNVRAHGDSAVVEYARRFDSDNFSPEMLRVGPDAFEVARLSVSVDVREAIGLAHENIRLFHEKQMPKPMWFTEVQPGVMAGEKTSPLPSVGLYVPRGKGAFPSVLLMLATPAIVAGVERIVVVTPPTPEGKADAATLVAAEICGIEEIYAVGGMQALAGLAYGTETLPKVDKIIGPGSSYVSAAKRLLYGVVDVGLPAGPSESIILADEYTDAHLAALDLLVEAEHGPESASILVTHNYDVAAEVRQILPEYIAALPEWRQQFVNSVLDNYGGILVTGNLDESVQFVNDFAPEHLEILTREPFAILNKIKNAGEILLGPLTPIPIANYCLGLNAILPTGGFARSFSSVSVQDFLKRSGVGYLSAEGYGRLQAIATTLAEYEGFPAHSMAIKKRNEILGL